MTQGASSEAELGGDIGRAVLDRIDENELVDLALALANLPGQPGEERPVAEFVAQWLIDKGFSTKKIGTPERFNVMGRLRGTGDGYSLLFNSHMDVERVEPQ